MTTVLAIGHQDGRLDIARPLTTLSLAPSLKTWLSIPIHDLDGKPVLGGSQALTTAERTDIQRRVDDLGSSLELRDVDRVMGAVTGCLAAFPTQGMSEDMAGARAKAYRLALEDIPPWAAAAACRAWLRGEVDGGAARFAPTPPELRKVCLQQMAPVLRQKRHLQRLLDAEPIPTYTPEERAKQKDRMQRLSAILAKRPDGGAE